VVVQGPRAVDVLRERLPEVRRVRREIRDIETGPIGVINHDQERIRLALRKLERGGVTSGPAITALKAQMEELETRYAEQAARLVTLRAGQTTTVLIAADASKEKDLPLVQVVDVYFPNAMSLPAKSVQYAAKARLVIPLYFQTQALMAG